ncbi:glycosyltransferase [Frankia sp. CNm7]|uniref:Glycosyltransferase n=1 Tax=Frankia nepalensis TaxID=1836974 RepID=A0A937REQ7_9ACTN|nr:glycosyltransferase [Frankia nepalensis]MBL7502675.1 glycosyltransferase [Frankia nepalensis]MBL7515533.1 glycosyltransferase [Frankia nepalensis]MBL7522788.1 glycosyltransferase [Frankia nepalensis]MBL7629060.1 glycosyltransferase [Frankia nepalensis]
MLVSIVLPTYDGARFVRRAIDSALSQEHRELELLVVDDGSRDSTVQIVQEYQDPRITLIQRTNGGVAAARGTGLEHASGWAVAFLDQDDEWLPRKLSIQLPVLAREGVAMVGGRMRYVDAVGRAIGVAGEPTEGRAADLAAATFMPFPFSSAVARRDLLMAAGGFDAALVRQVAPVDDLDLVSRLAGYGQIVTVPEIVGRYRVHGGSETTRKFFAMQAGTQFLAARVRARAAGGDLTWEQFNATYRRSLWRRRAEYARFFYRRAGVSFASGQTAVAVSYLGTAAALGPLYTARRLRRQRKLL